MSTKIWTAWRVKRGRDIWDLVPTLRARATAACEKALADIYCEMVAIWKSDEASHATAQRAYRRMLIVRVGKSAAKRDLRKTAYGASEYVREAYRAQLGSEERNPFDLTVAITARKSRVGWLLVPYAGSGLFSSCLDFMRRMPELDDYHYQNSSDQPPEVTRRAWRERARTWEPLLDDWGRYLAIDIVPNATGLVHVDPVWKIKSRHRKRLNELAE